ncbi:MAG: AraC family transcriptional regulator [Gemmiger sp.]|uniref:helix-turn-helix domain-containing protein n=1 Tax=Gemmiger sp. TaxID=2049027 RepID=UPI002E767AC9|nr:AraC family transcriptional regulator [Gemmiger sp.]MEE0799645.1 AraC family transcriptional regulator [Gemmiger sp.]
MNQTEWPVRVTGVQASAFTEWRSGQQSPERFCEAWQLVYVHSSVVEEISDGRRIPLRSGQLLFHQPDTTHSMRAAGEVPPEVLRIEFTCEGSAVDDLRELHLRANAAERNCLRLLIETGREVFAPVTEPWQMPAPRAEIPYAARELQELYLNQLLLLVLRRRRRTRRPGPRARAEQEQAALVEGVRLYFAQNIEKSLTLPEVCRANGCSRAALQQAFRARVHTGPMDYFARMKAEKAGALLASGYGPGEVAKMLGYGSQAWFCRRFYALTGQTPTAFRRAPHLLHLCEL